jgi:antitoxin VapB
MGLNIKNPETQRLARELARGNNETLTAAITIALRERLERQERQKRNRKEGLVEWLDELSKRTAPLLKGLPPSDQIGDLLFDKETGLPK